MPEDGVLTETPESTGTEQAAPVEGEKEQKQETAIDDPRYAGKSPSQLVEMLKEKESFIGKQANESVGQVRQLAEQVNYLRGLVESRQFVPEGPTPAKPPKPEFDFTNPEAYVSHLVSEQVDGLRRDLAKRDAEQYIRSARVNMERGFKEAMAKSPTLFAGIENGVQQAVAQQVRGGSIAPELLGDARTW